MTAPTLPVEQGPVTMTTWRKVAEAAIPPGLPGYSSTEEFLAPRAAAAVEREGHSSSRQTAGEACSLESVHNVE